MVRDHVDFFSSLALKPGIFLPYRYFEDGHMMTVDLAS